MDEPLDVELAWLVEAGIENLTKYNIVHFLAQRPSYKGDDVQLAKAVGLRPGTGFVSALEELVAAQIISLRLTDEGSPRFVVAVTDEYRAPVAKLTELNATSADFSALMRRLAAGSLRQVTRELLP